LIDCVCTEAENNTTWHTSNDISENRENKKENYPTYEDKEYAPREDDNDTGKDKQENKD
jgi:hypothetical protein